MANGSQNHVLEHLRKLVGGDSRSDQELVERFIAHHENAVFATLLQRHGPLVLGVCERVLNHREDAEDAFQATFLVLARQARSIRKYQSLGSWLYGVAYRLSLKLKAAAARRSFHERRAVAMHEPELCADAVWQDLRPLLDQELHCLPEKYRAPLVLCYLQGKTQLEAAREWGCPPGSMSRQLSRGRDLLRARLRQRGVSASAGVFATVVGAHAQAVPSTALVQLSSRAAVLAATGGTVTTIVSGHVAALAEGVIRTMLVTKLKVGLAILATTAALVTTTALALPRTPEAAPTEAPQEAKPQLAASSRLPADLALVPAEAVGFARIDVSRLWNSKAMKALREKADNPGMQALSQAEKYLGVRVDDLEAVTLIVMHSAGRGGLTTVWVFTTKRPYSQDAVHDAVAPGGKDAQHNGKSYAIDTEHKGKSDFFGLVHDANAVYFATERSFLLTSELQLKRYFEFAANAGQARPLAAALRLAEQPHTLVAGFRPWDQLVQELRGKASSGEAAFLKPLLDLQSGSLVADVATEIRIRARLQFAQEAQAKDAAEAVETCVGVLKALVAGVPDKTRQEPQAAALLNEALATLRTVSVEPVQAGRQAASIQVTLHTKAELALEASLANFKLDPTASRRAQKTNDLKQIGLAMHNYHDVNKHFPPAVITDKTGKKSLLSWRVAILPYLGEGELYKQFHLDEPFYSEHNLKLLSKMPKAYAPANVKTQEPYMTFFRVFAGKGTVFEQHEGVREGVRIADITDGTSNTFLVVEAGDAVPWTKPDELHYAADQPLPKLGGDTPGGIIAAFADGSVRRLASTVDERTLRAFITRNGGEVIPRP